MEQLELTYTAVENTKLFNHSGKQFLIKAFHTTSNFTPRHLLQQKQKHVYTERDAQMLIAVSFKKPQNWKQMKNKNLGYLYILEY